MSSGDKDDQQHSPLRRRPSTPDTPRKRRRLGSLGRHAAGARKHDAFRRRDVETNYSDEYRVLFNDEVAHAALRFPASESVLYYSKQVGSSIWSPHEQAVFFAALERLGKDDLPGIAKAIGTKSTAEARDLLLLLQDAATTHGDAKITLRDLPAAVELGHACSQQLEDAGDALAWYQERFEAAQEQERHGKYWLITPALAEEIEDAISDRAPSRPASVSRDREPSKFGPGVAGACAPCRKAKRKCDRKMPCAQCARTGADCTYPKNPPNFARSGSVLKDAPDGYSGNATQPQILQAIPEARLLQPEVMLTLSRELFMNRSDDISSPWPHWSHYVSELASEPSIARTAFNDFHSLAISVTKRLVQVAIVQASSRMRSQRSRNEKGSHPLVKIRDVLSAIDVLGMARDGRERWRGVARRCALRVTASRLTPKGRRTRGVSWSEVESLMRPATLPNEPSHTSAELEDFKLRAVRSGTPLPLHNLTLSDVEDEVVEMDSIDDDESEYSENLTDAEPRPSPQRVLQPRDPTGRYATFPLDTTVSGIPSQLMTLEEFDWKAARIEEKTLCDLLSISALPKESSLKYEDDAGRSTFDDDEKIKTLPQHWRQVTEYNAPWETYESFVSVDRSLAQKLMSSTPTRDGVRTYSTESLSDDLSDASSTKQPRRSRHRLKAEVDLRVRGTNAYAALQREGLENTSPDAYGNSSGAGSETPEEDVPTQSIEAEQRESDIGVSGSDMDWS